MALISMTLADRHFSLLFCFGVQIAVVGLLVWTTVAGRDLWPFSHYPMFSEYQEGRGERVFQLRCHFSNGCGAVIPANAGSLAEEFSRAFQRYWSGATPDGSAQRQLALDFWRKTCRYEPLFVSAVRIEVVLRAAMIAKTGKITVAEKIVCSVETAGLVTG